MALTLNTALETATSGLSAVEGQYSVASNNIANQHTPGYVRESSGLASIPTGGVRQVDIHLNIDSELQQEFYNQNSKVAGYQEADNSLSTLKVFQGTTNGDPGETGSLSDNVGNLHDSFVDLTNDPLNSATQQGIISSANNLVTKLHTLSKTYQDGRNHASSRIQEGVSQLNIGLARIGQLNNKIVHMHNVGQDPSSLENDRREVANNISNLAGLRFSTDNHENMHVYTRNGEEIPTKNPHVKANVPTPSPYDPTAATVTLGKTVLDIKTGVIGSNLKLRNVTYPHMAHQLDNFAYILQRRFKDAGLNLFDRKDAKTIPDPTSEYAGVIDHNDNDIGDNPLKGDYTGKGFVNLAHSIEVNPNYVHSPDKLVGNDGDISNLKKVLQNTFADSNKVFSSNPKDHDLGYSMNQSLSDLAASLTSSQGNVINYNKQNLQFSSSMKVGISAKVNNVSGVNINREMANVVALQASFQANSKVIEVVQSMYSSLMGAIQ